MSYDLSSFSFTDMMDCRERLRSLFLAREPWSLEEGAQRIVRFLYEDLVDEEGRPGCALVRLFKTHPYDDLDEDLKSAARQIAPGADRIHGLRCLVLLATAGDLPEWGSRHLSTAHKAIPLSSDTLIEREPMIAEMIRQFGIEVSAVLRPSAEVVHEMSEKTLEVFHVFEAETSPFIAEQDDFVVRYGIHSVVGFGTMLPTGDLFATLLFTKVHITDEAAALFRVLGLNLKLVLLPLAQKPMLSR